MPTLKWKRSDDGYTETKCGRYGIEPLYCSTTRPQGYNLYFYPTPGTGVGREKLNFWLDTQGDAKRKAEAHAQSSQS